MNISVRFNKYHAILIAVGAVIPLFIELFFQIGIYGPAAVLILVILIPITIGIENGRIILLKYLLAFVMIAGLFSLLYGGLIFDLLN